MGQRSQMYVRINKEDGTYHLVASYFQWNYGTRMVSRARGTLEWLISMSDYPTSLWSWNKGKLPKIMEINWDYKDIVESIDIINEYKEGYYNEPIQIFRGQDNNDGQFILDMIVDYSKKDKKGDNPVSFKYAFLNWDSELVGNGEDYMQWNENYGDDGPAWRENKYITNEIKYTERNIKYLDKHAQLMTSKEVEEFVYHDYMKDMGISIRKAEVV